MHVFVTIGSGSVGSFAVEIGSKYGLLITDCMHVAAMRKYGITHLATNDSDFERVDGIQIWRP